jgi:uncharacterized protein YndB with AHSA1/START domain
MLAIAPRIDRAEAWVAAPPARVFAAWTDPALLARWLPPAGMTGRMLALEARPGGAFRMVLTHDDPRTPGKSGGGEDQVTAEFVTLDPPRHRAFVSRFASDDPAFQGDMRMDWTFVPEGAGTRVRIAATAVPPGISPQDHADGMAASLKNLAALFA